jgi:hypothetical protein
LSRDEADRMLKRYGGNLRSAIDEVARDDG